VVLVVLVVLALISLIYSCFLKRVFCRHVGDRKPAVQGLELGNSPADWQIHILNVNKSELFQRVNVLQYSLNL